MPHSIENNFCECFYASFENIKISIKNVWSERNISSFQEVQLEKFWHPQEKHHFALIKNLN